MKKFIVLFLMVTSFAKATYGYDVTGNHSQEGVNALTTLLKELKTREMLSNLVISKIVFKYPSSEEFSLIGHVELTANDGSCTAYPFISHENGKTLTTISPGLVGCGVTYEDL